MCYGKGLRGLRRRLGANYFQRPFSFKRNPSDEDRQPRFQRTTSHSHSPNSSPSDASLPIQEDHVGSTTSLPQTSTYLYSRKPSDHSRKLSKADPGFLGLNIINTPESGHKVGIVFIHGLRGTSRRTWSKNVDPELSWPFKFLPFEPDVCLTRIRSLSTASWNKVSLINTSS